MGTQKKKEKKRESRKINLIIMKKEMRSKINKYKQLNNIFLLFLYLHINSSDHTHTHANEKIKINIYEM